MAISAKFLRVQLSMLKPVYEKMTLEAVRNAQDSIGLLMAHAHKRKVSFSTQVFKDFIGEWIIPKQNKQKGVILYLHGGGYVAGNIGYAKGFGTVLAVNNEIRVFCIAYRLAPENPFPAALDDALEAYRYLLLYGYDSSDIILCGESAGGGLAYALVQRIKQLEIPLPAGLIAISPWSDLTLSGLSYETNAEKDPSMSKDRLKYFAEQYTSKPDNPLVSPLFCDLSAYPPSLIFVGGDEILLDDSTKMHQKLRESGSSSSIYIAAEMWHAYLLYGVKPSKRNHAQINEFIRQRLKSNG